MQEGDNKTFWIEQGQTVFIYLFIVELACLIVGEFFTRDRVVFLVGQVFFFSLIFTIKCLMRISA